MKRMLLLLLIVLSFPVLCMGESAIQSEGNMSYIITSEGAVIIDWDNQLPDVLDATLYVPPTLGGIPVVGIGFDAFDTCNEGPSTQFQLILPEGITFLEKGAFQCCNQATVISLPSTLETIPEGSFIHVTAEIVFPNGNPYFTAENGFLIDNRTNTLLYTSKSSGDFPLPPVKQLASRCLDNWIDENTTEIILPLTLEGISSYVFYDFPWLESVLLPNGMKNMGKLAFYTSGVNEIVLPASILSVPAYCFVECYLDSVVISEGTQYIGEYAFYWNRGALANVELLFSVQFVGYNAFPEGCNISALNPNTHFESLEEYQLRDPNGEW